MAKEVVEKLRRKMRAVEARTGRKKKRPPMYHNARTFVIGRQHQSPTGSDDTSFEEYVRQVSAKLHAEGVQGGLQSEKSAHIQTGIHGGQTGVFLDLTTKKIQLFFPEANIEGVKRLLKCLITRR